MRYLITGASGFIGSHLTDELLAHGHEVVGADRNKAVRDIPHSVLDVGDHLWFNFPLSHYTPDRVIHLAAAVGRQNSELDKEDTIRENVLVTTNVATACAEHRIPLTYFSTSEIYGDQPDAVKVKLSEEDAGLYEPKNIYGLTKWWGEQICRLYAPRDLQIIRPTMPYGPGVPPGEGRRALDNFLWWAHHRKPINVHIGAVRSWVWISDLTRAIRFVLEDDQRGTWNVGRDDDSVSMMHCADLACEITGAPRSLITVSPSDSTITLNKQLSCAKLERMHWKPTVELPEGMRMLYEWVSQFDQKGSRVVN